MTSSSGGWRRRLEGATWCRAIPGGFLGLALLLAPQATPVKAQGLPLLVTYGPGASTKEGDHDYKEVIFLRIPGGLSDTLFLRVFDADSGADHDLIYTRADTETRYRLYGGPGAFTVPTAAQLASGDADETAGVLLSESRHGRDPTLNDAWHTMASFTADQGEKIGDQVVFKLVVEGVSGDDANLFDVTVSLRQGRNLAPDGLEMFAFSPTIRVWSRDVVAELRFPLASDTEEIVVHNFDSANAQVDVATALRSLAIPASGQDEWREGRVVVLEEERGQAAAIVFGGGDEIPNDATFYVTDQAGKGLPITLPIRALRRNRRPLARAAAAALADCTSYAFDGSGSSDPDGDRLSFAWDFGDGQGAVGPAVVHRFRDPGSYRVVLRATDSSGQPGNSAAAPLEVAISRLPNAAAGPDRTVAPGETIEFDASASTPGESEIARHQWDFGDGQSARGRTAAHAFAAPGDHRVILRVEDGSQPPCNFALDEATITVNAQPVAEAGSDRQVSVGEPVALDGGRSYDLDGALGAHVWDLGDGDTATGAQVSHAYAAPGAYDVTLTVRDDSGLANDSSADRLRVLVNAPPLAAAGDDRRAAIGEVIALDATDSADPDGRILDYIWDFGDGGLGRGPRVSYAYGSAGTYLVRLTVRDDSATATERDDDTLVVTVNQRPTSEAGDDQLVTSSLVEFDGTGSADADGAIETYLWDFGDGTTSADPAPRHVYQSPGSYQVRLTVTDASGTIRNTAEDDMTVVVNAAPIADAGVDQLAAPGQTLTFLGTGSIDPDGEVVGYSWDFGDGTTASGPRVSHAFARSGIHTVRLTVRDDTGHANALDYDEAQVVINAPPVANAGTDVLVTPGDPVRLSAASSYDLDGQIASYRWDFSDSDQIVEARDATRTFETPGAYTARLTVVDDSGATNAVAQDQMAIRVNHPPIAAPGDDLVGWDNKISFDGSGSADPDGDALTYSWDFGDGTPPQRGARVTHIYAEGGTYPVILTVDDGTGLANASDDAAIKVVIDRAPVAAAGGHRMVCAGDIVVFDGSESRDPEGGLLRYVWDGSESRDPEGGLLRLGLRRRHDRRRREPDQDLQRRRALSRHLDRAGRYRAARQPPYRPGDGHGHRVADLRGRAGSDGLRQQRGALRRLRLARRRRRGQSLFLGLRRRHAGRRRAAEPYLRPGRDLPRGPDHRGRPGRPVRQ